MSDHPLSPRQQAIIPIAAFTANGDQTRLQAALTEGLDAGLTVSEIKEIMVQLYAYAGFPRSLNGLNTFMAVLGARENCGKADEPGNDATLLPAGTNMLEMGAANQTRLAGGPVTGPLYDFAPAIDQFLKSHLFGDIFARDNLDWQNRELATVAALAAMDGVDPQLLAHINLAMNTGLTQAQLRELAVILETRTGERIGARAKNAMESVLGH